MEQREDKVQLVEEVLLAEPEHPVHQAKQV